MSETKVYGCDWCDDIVGKKRPIVGGPEEPDFAATVTIEGLGPFKTAQPQVDNICYQCRRALLALTEGKYKR